MWPALISCLLILTVLRSEEGSGICQFAVLILFLCVLVRYIARAVVSEDSKNILRTCDSVSTPWSCKRKKSSLRRSGCEIARSCITASKCFSLNKERQPLWSSAQRYRFRLPALPYFPSSHWNGVHSAS
jgi:hypothetical protein